RIRFSWNDAITQSDIKANLNHLDTRIGTFDPDNLIYEIPEINVDGLNVQMRQGATTDNAASASIQNNDISEGSQPLDLRLGDISLKNFSLNLSSDEAGLDTNLDLKEMIGKINELQ